MMSLGVEPMVLYHPRLFGTGKQQSRCYESP